ncbi:hypothetical protein HMPREF0724_11030 [Prescottella equi ATCC 33707]|uniref:Uncharacterized protein n=1 Tax=Prescottella equi ATCC 33707 TaxID=525370 RepID=E9SYM8_RHOHA|nr:hypothetical protein HMPREF0724_11030 [Prescottella equi ATCC 33707]
MSMCPFMTNDPLTLVSRYGRCRESQYSVETEQVDAKEWSS